MKHKVKVVKLPTKGKSGLQLAPDGSLRFTANNTWESQHSYATVSQDIEPIKKGDWITDGIEVIKASSKIVNAQGLVNRRNWCKIIATTDKSLGSIITKKDGLLNRLQQEGKIKSFLPQLPQSFLKEFVANPDGEYEVEYEIIGHYNNDKSRNWESRLKLNPDNTVNITSVEERIYSGKEVKVLINKTIDKWRYEKDTGTTIRNNWIKDNLK